MSTKVQRHTCTECGYQSELGESEPTFCPKCDCDEFAWGDEA